MILLLNSSQGLAGLSTEVGFNPSLIPGILDPLLGHKNLLDSCTKTTERKTPLVRHAKELTRARSLYRDRKRSGCLMCFKAAISFSKRRGCSRALAR